LKILLKIPYYSVVKDRTAYPSLLIEIDDSGKFFQLTATHRTTRDQD